MFSEVSIILPLFFVGSSGLPSYLGRTIHPIPLIPLPKLEDEVNCKGIEADHTRALLDQDTGEEIIHNAGKKGERRGERMGRGEWEGRDTVGMRREEGEEMDQDTGEEIIHDAGKKGERREGGEWEEGSGRG